MTANTSIDLEAFLHEQLAQASPDLMREMLGTLINALLCAQADTVCGAPYATRTLERVNSRNGFRHRDLHTKAGTLDVAIPKLREGTSFRDLTARGLSGVALVTSDAHAGLIAAIGATLPDASWQRCRTHYAANLMALTPRSQWGWTKALLQSVYDQPDAGSVHAQVRPGPRRAGWQAPHGG